MKRAINFRPLLFVFLGMLLGVVFASFIVQKNIFAFVAFSIIMFFSVFLVLWVKLFKKTEKLNFVINFILCLVIGLTISMLSSLIGYTKFTKAEVEENNKLFVTARVEVCNFKSNYYVLTLENLKFYDETKKIAPSGKMRLTFNSENEIENLKTGSTISFYSTVYQNNLIEDGKFNSYYYKNNLRFSALTSLSDVIVSSGELKFDEIVKEKVKNLLYSNMDYNSASLSYASIFGDKTMLDGDVYSLFSVSGTAHILAVSGLHVGFLTSFIFWILKKCKIKDKYSFIILFVILSVYSYLCSFSPSVVRASIMSLVFIFSSVIGKRNDSLSSISFAGILILCFKPFYVFDLGFELSFASSFGIILLTPLFENFFRKINFLNKFTKAFSLTLSAQLATFPIILHNFERLSFLSLLANIVIVPLFSVVFIVLICVVLINLIFNFGFLFIIPNYLFKIILLFAKFFGSFESAIISVSGLEFFANVLFYALLFCLSRFLVIKNYFKNVLVIMCAILFTISALVTYMPTTFNDLTLFNIENTNSTIITNSDDYRMLINTGQMAENSDILTNFLKNYKIKRIDTIIYTNYIESDQQVLVEFCEKYKVQKIYLNPSSLDSSVNYLIKKVKNAEIIKTEEDYYFVENFGFQILEDVGAVDLNLLESSVSVRMFVVDKLNLIALNYIKQNNLALELVSTNIIEEEAYFGVENELDKEIIFCKDCQFGAKNIIRSYNRIKLESYL